jgi:hypothetical protein
MRYKTASDVVVSEEEGIAAMQIPDASVTRCHLFTVSASQSAVAGNVTAKGMDVRIPTGYMDLGPSRIRMLNVSTKGISRRKTSTVSACRWYRPFQWSKLQQSVIRSIFGVT